MHRGNVYLPYRVIEAVCMCIQENPSKETPLKCRHLIHLDTIHGSNIATAYASNNREMYRAGFATFIVRKFCAFSKGVCI